MTLAWSVSWQQGIRIARSRCPIVHSRGPDNVRCGYRLPRSLSDDAGAGGRIGGYVIVCYCDAFGPQIALDAKQQHVVG